MNLGFSTHINNKPTYFVEKIWAGLINKISDVTISDYEHYLKAHQSLFGSDFGYNELMIQPKLHTIRRDEKNLWKPGNFIHFVINNRTPNRFQFAPLLKCISVQTIEICYDEDICEIECCEPAVFIDGNAIDFETLETLALNDGFDSIEDFFNWFSQDFTGKIIHWTDLKY